MSHYVYVNRFNIKMKSSGDGLSGYMRLALILKQPFLVSSGITWSKGGRPLLKFFETDGKVIIPGSSIKGAFRTYFELFFDDGYVSYVLGSADNASRMFFSDIIVLKKDMKTRDISRQYSPRRFKKGYKLYRCGKAGIERITVKKRFLVECIPENTVLEEIVHFRDLTLNDLKNFLTAVGANPNHPFIIKIGRGKNKGLGDVKVELKEIFNFLTGRTVNVSWGISKDLANAIQSYKKITQCP